MIEGIFCKPTGSIEIYEISQEDFCLIVMFRYFIEYNLT